MKKITLLFALLLGLSLYTFPQLSITATSTNYTISFDATVAGVNDGQYAGSGFTPTPAAGQLDSDAWATTGMSDGASAFGDTKTTSNTDFTRGVSAGGVTTGGFYAFTVATGNRAFGIQPGGTDWTPGTITLRIINNTGSTITALDVDYNIVVLNNEDRSNSFNFSYSSDNSAYTAVASLDYNTPEAKDGSPSWQTVPRSTTITGISIADGNYFYIRWFGDDVSGAGNRDEYGVDDIVLNASTGPVNLPPEITNISNTPALPTSSQTVAVQADVTDDVSVASVNCKWGLADGGPYSNTIGMTLSSGDTYVTNSN
ncbi:MAG TPA: hypothetical protein VIN10_06130, partial [Bacteroidales bacterium]